MSNKRVWALEQGSYSDYHVIGVFSTKENAERAAKFLGGGYDKPTVAEWVVDPGAEGWSKGFDKWTVVMLRDGTVEDTRRDNSPYDFDVAQFIWERTKAPAYKDKGVPDALSATVWAKDRKHAIKIVNEKRTQMIAEGQWVGA